MNRFASSATAAAVLALGAAAAHAQSSVTVFGTVDVGVSHVRSDTGSRTGLSHSGANISRFGFRGVEDLGGGMSASFWLEAGFSPDTGEVNAGFNRRATVSLNGRWGELRLGRDDSATFLNTLIFDPFLTNGVGGTNAFVMNGAPTIQISNAVSYFLPPNLGGFYGQVQHAFSERLNTDPTVAGEYNGARFGWRQGGFHASASAAKLQGLTQAQDQRFRNVGLSYDFGVAQPMLLWASHKRGDLEVRGLQLGVKVPVGAGEIRASVARYDTRGNNSNADWNKVALGYGHNLSRRTQLYATVARVNNAEGALKAIGVQGLAAPTNVPGGKSTGYEVGMRHFF
ncbi:porin [Xenophilus arseniciresistens]|uniref:Porin n=1 Tax=Xenophilus arseniciresistens TaxID=1283306 RepID=A0AAE3NAJ3_9BURK|nr:porin [Xenophilus arseniciresistens]MDA7417341.1 porin [Xenophilus arseniciresistens]